jgi:hypothetical protein
MEFVLYHADAVYDRFAPTLVTEPAIALRESARLFADLSPAAIEEFGRRHRIRDDDARERLVRLCEMERAAHAALTSCAWFFDDFSGLEGRVALRWAARAVELAAEVAADIEHPLLERLCGIHSNRTEFGGDAASLYLSLKTREARGRA